MDEGLQDKPSKSALKRAHKERQKQVEKLCNLRDEKFQRMNLPERIAEELAIARDMKRSSARNRQIRYITNLISDLDDAQIAQLDSALD